MLNNKNERLNSLFKLDVKSGILFFNSKVHKVFLKIGRMTVSHLTNTYAVIPQKWKSPLLVIIMLVITNMKYTQFFHNKKKMADIFICHLLFFF